MKSRIRRIVLVLTGAALLAGAATAIVPPGYRLIQVTRNDYLELQPKINNLESRAVRFCQADRFLRGR